MYVKSSWTSARITEFSLCYILWLTILNSVSFFSDKSSIFFHMIYTTKSVMTVVIDPFCCSLYRRNLFSAFGMTAGLCCMRYLITSPIRSYQNRRSQNHLPQWYGSILYKIHARFMYLWQASIMQQLLWVNLFSAKEIILECSCVGM